MTEKWIALWEDADEPIVSKSSLGTMIPVWDNPISAREWAQTQSRIAKYYVREIEMLYLPRRNDK